MLPATPGRVAIPGTRLTTANPVPATARRWPRTRPASPPPPPRPGRPATARQAADHPWVVGYAFDVPCYIPSMRVLKEGGYEADSSLIYYGIYGPLLPKSETLILEKFRELSASLRK